MDAQEAVSLALRILNSRDKGKANLRLSHELEQHFHRIHAHAMARRLKAWRKADVDRIGNPWDRRPIGQRRAQLDRYVSRKANRFERGGEWHTLPKAA